MIFNQKPTEEYVVHMIAVDLLGHKGLKRVQGKSSPTPEEIKAIPMDALRTYSLPVVVGPHQTQLLDLDSHFIRFPSGIPPGGVFRWNGDEKDVARFTDKFLIDPSVLGCMGEMYLQNQTSAPVTLLVEVAHVRAEVMINIIRQARKDRGVPTFF